MIATKKPMPVLQGYRIDHKGRLILFLAQNGVYFTRRIKLGAEAGMPFYIPQNQEGHFSYGWEKRPTVRYETVADGRRIKSISHKRKRPFAAKASVEMLEQLAADCWPLMDLDTNKRPAAYSEDVQPVQPDYLAQAAD